MLPKVTFGIISVIVGICCEDSKFKIFEKNGLRFTVTRGEFIVDGASIPVLRQRLIADIEEMERLWLTRSNISTIEPGAFEKLPNLKNLYITFNNLKKIEVGVFNGLNITTLSIADNNVEEIASRAFDNMTHLVFIDISFNKLKKWDVQWFAKTPSVEFFFLYYNLFTEIPAEAFGETKRTGDSYYISFYGNPINQIEDDAFKNFEVVRHLRISINNSDALDGNFLEATRFEKVDIRIDKIKCLDGKYFSKIFVADSTKLTGNAFDSSCKSNISAWATAHQKAVKITN